MTAELIEKIVKMPSLLKDDENIKNLLTNKEFVLLLKNMLIILFTNMWLKNLKKKKK